MQVKIGEKIKDLRKVTGRKQEDLATALGVTPQAVSRWEANGGYPDMEMIPSIANYFHITIDELFGYNNDRNRIIQEYNDKAQWLINNNDDMTECIALMRRGLEEFPDRVDFKTKLNSRKVFDIFLLHFHVSGDIADMEFHPFLPVNKRPQSGFLRAFWSERKNAVEYIAVRS